MPYLPINYLPMGTCEATDSSTPPVSPGNGSAFALLSVGLPDAPPYLFVGNGDTLHAFDIWSESLTVYDVIYTTRPAFFGKPGRNDRQRAKRAIFYGEAESITGTLTFHADNRTEEYTITEVYDATDGILIWQECSEAMTGYILYCTLAIETATGLLVRDFRMEGEILG